MKSCVLTFFFIFTTVWVAKAQIVDMEYLNPKMGDGTQYRYIRFGTPTKSYGGLMWNNNNVYYGNGNDVSIFTYGNRDITIRTGSGNFIVFPTSGGNLGVGTTSPSAKLDVNGEISSNMRVKVTNPENPIANLHLGWLNNTARIRIGGSGVGAGNGLDIQTVGDKSLMRLLHNGNIGIGTTDPGSWKLAVNGKIRAKEIKVETGWSDFVFEEDYDLPTLEEVEAHIKEKGHLKDIPSAREVKENGVLLGEMDAKLLQKIEELTLYILDQDKQIKKLQEENSGIKVLEDKLDKLLQQQQQ